MGLLGCPLVPLYLWKTTIPPIFGTALSHLRKPSMSRGRKLRLSAQLSAGYSSVLPLLLVMKRASFGPHFHLVASVN